MLRYVLFGMALLWSCWVFGEATLTKAEYKREVVRLLDEYVRLRDIGVFLDDAEINALGDYLEAAYPPTKRNGHPPGMFFSRPPGKTWIEDVNALREIEVEGGFESTCFRLPYGMYIEFMCGADLYQLYMATTGEQEPDEQDAVLAQMRLALICDEHRSLCGLKTDAEYEAETDAELKALLGSE